jgi:hypothetical protein
MNYRAIWISDVTWARNTPRSASCSNFSATPNPPTSTSWAISLIGGSFAEDGSGTTSHTLIQKLLRKNHKHTHVTFITGNHDEFLEEFFGIPFGRCASSARGAHRSERGAVPGHPRPPVRRAGASTGCSSASGRCSRAILDLNVWISPDSAQLRFGMSFASYIKLRAKSAVKYVTDYEDTMLQFGRKSGMSGVICGHIHRPEIRQVGDMLYMNCGDWVENCTALVEDFDGNFSLIRFHESDVHGAGRGPRAHDAGDRDAGDAAATRTPRRRRPRRVEPQPEPAGIL